MGLANIGATCYINATVQSFFHTPVIRNYFLHKTADNTKKLSTSFSAALRKSYKPSKSNEYKPYIELDDFKNTISEMNSLFAGVKANDAKDLLNFIIMTLHEELNKAKDKINSNNAVFDQRNCEAVLQAFLNNCFTKNQSVISDELYGVHFTTSECLGTTCKENNILIYNYQIYFFIVFPLYGVFSNVTAKKQPLNQTNQNQILTVSLQDCFEYDSNGNLMFGANAMYCNYCKRESNFIMTAHLVTVPKTLILLLNRGKGKESTVNIDYPKCLDQYTLSSDLLSNEKINMKWKLKKITSTIAHIGQSGEAGHFISFTKSQLDGQYYKFNDAIVTPDQAVIPVANQKSFMPYLLFYNDMEAEEIIHEIEGVVLNYSYLKCILGKLANLTDKIKREKFAYLLGYVALCFPHILSPENKSDLICATFKLIKMEAEFSEGFMEKCRVIIHETATWMRQNHRVGDPNTTVVNDIIVKINSYSFQFSNVRVNICQNQSCYPDEEKYTNAVITNQQNIVEKQKGYSKVARKKINNRNKSKLTWLQICSAPICIILAVTLLILELYWLIFILVVLIFLTFVVPKLCRPCCGNLLVFQTGSQDKSRQYNGEYIKDEPISARTNEYCKFDN